MKKSASFLPHFVPHPERRGEFRKFGGIETPECNPFPSSSNGLRIMTMYQCTLIVILLLFFNMAGSAEKLLQLVMYFFSNFLIGNSV